MRKAFLGSMSSLVAGAGLALAQPAPVPRAVEQAPVVAVSPEAPRSPYWPTPANWNKPDAGCADKDVAPKHEFNECFWVSAEYLAWWLKDSPSTVPLVTVSPPGSLGVVGNPGTNVVVGNNDFDYDTFSGARFTAGIWLDKCTQSLAFEGTGFFLERRADSFRRDSSPAGAPLIARPYINAIDGSETALLITSPGAFAGNVEVGCSASLYGLEMNFIRPNLYSEPGMRFDLIAGFRYLHLDEDLRISQTSQLLPAGAAAFAGQFVTAPALIGVQDRFYTQNDFYGGQLGVRGEYRMDRIILQGFGKLGLGVSHQVVTVNGRTSLNGTTAQAIPNAALLGIAPQPIILPGGLLAQATNSGHFSNDTFAVLPEFGFNVGYELCRGLKIFTGYTFMYYSEVVRPGDQINRAVNPNTLTTSASFGLPGGPAQPAPVFQSTDFWAQGLNFGIEYRY